MSMSTAEINTRYDVQARLFCPFNEETVVGGEAIVEENSDCDMGTQCCNGETRIFWQWICQCPQCAGENTYKMAIRGFDVPR